MSTDDRLTMALYHAEQADKREQECDSRQTRACAACGHIAGEQLDPWTKTQIHTVRRRARMMILRKLSNARKARDEARAASDESKSQKPVADVINAEIRMWKYLMQLINRPRARVRR